MGLYDRVKARKKETPAGGGLLRKSLKTRTVRPAAPKAAPPAPITPAAAEPRVRSLHRHAAAAVRQPATKPARPESGVEALASAISRLEAGLDAPLLLFEQLTRALSLSRATLFLADYARGAFVPCASRGPRSGSLKPVTDRIESLFDYDELRPLNPQTAAIFGELSDGGELRLKPYKSGDNPVGILVLAPPASPVDAGTMSAALNHPEIVSLLLASSEQLGGFPPVSLASLEGVRPAGQSMLLSISYRELAAALAARAPSVDAAWLADALQRIVARLVGPLGTVGVLPGVPVAVLTERSVDAEIIAHQISLLLGRYLRSLRPLPGLSVSQSGG